MLLKPNEGVAAGLVDRYAATPLDRVASVGDNHCMVDGPRGRLLAHALLRAARSDMIAALERGSRQRC